MKKLALLNILLLGLVSYSFAQTVVTSSFDSVRSFISGSRITITEQLIPIPTDSIVCGQLVGWWFISTSGDTIRIPSPPPDTVFISADTVFIPTDTVYWGDTTRTSSSAPDTVYIEVPVPVYDTVYFAANMEGNWERVFPDEEEKREWKKRRDVTAREKKKKKKRGLGLSFKRTKKDKPENNQVHKKKEKKEKREREKKKSKIDLGGCMGDVMGVVAIPFTLLAKGAVWLAKKAINPFEDCPCDKDTGEYKKVKPPKKNVVPKREKRKNEAKCPDF